MNNNILSKKTRLYLYPYRNGSKSVRVLADALGAKVIRREGSRFVPREYKKVINWGSSDCPYLPCLNLPSNVLANSNKLTAFNSWSGLENSPRVPRWTTSKEETFSWNKTVVCRHVLNGHSGNGVEIIPPNDSDPRPDLPNAPLYVEYIPKDAEYRVHVFNGEIIDVQRKIKDPDREVTDWRVRSHRNGFIYVRSDSQGRLYRDTIPDDIRTQALRAMACSGLCFGGVDIVWNQTREKSYVLEINSAPGLASETTQKYAEAIKRYYNVL